GFCAFLGGLNGALVDAFAGAFSGAFVDAFAGAFAGALVDAFAGALVDAFGLFLLIGDFLVAMAGCVDASG
ncbi:hypothetical protein A2U01_0112270, partial [Trifolium medium]|nr:hypothetical protein [Trifolium medium]